MSVGALCAASSAAPKDLGCAGTDGERQASSRSSGLLADG